MGLLEMSPIEWLTVLVALVGVLIMLISAVGLLRLPDCYLRMHAASNAHVLGISVLLLAVALYNQSLVILGKMLVCIGCFLLTAPLVMHMLGRAAYVSGIKRVGATRIDDLKGAYDPAQRELRSFQEGE